ncbi:MAG: WxL domain-containing protein, partial [Lacticaseibacillus paracasei]
ETGTKSGQGQGNNQTTIGTRTALTLVATNTNVTIAKGRYQGAITWTLSNEPKG